MRVVTILLILAFAGCASMDRAKIAERAKTEMVGMSKKEVLMCAGIPVRSQQIEDVELITYMTAHSSASTDNKGALTVDNRDCEITFVLTNGVVNKLTYKGDTGGMLSEGEQCGYILQNCIQLK